MKFPFITSFARGAKLFELAFFPSFCKICGTIMDTPEERVLCQHCLNKIRPHRSSFCPSCGRFFEGAGEPHLCASCLKKSPPFSIHRSCAKYSGELKDALLLFKYRRYKSLGTNLGRFVAETLKKEDGIWWGADLITPVPLHRRRLKDRGFNQAAVLAEEIARLKGVPLVKGVLKKIKNVPPQTSMEHEERTSNVRGAYRAAAADKIQGKVVLLVDDVYTTGSTLRECASVLKKAGAKDVRAVTVAQA
ncbi:MAG: ComF family protein [Candidatus Aminicenantales bacterium]